MWDRHQAPQGESQLAGGVACLDRMRRGRARRPKTPQLPLPVGSRLAAGGGDNQSATAMAMMRRPTRPRRSYSMATLLRCLPMMRLKGNASRVNPCKTPEGLLFPSESVQDGVREGDCEVLAATSQHVQETKNLCSHRVLSCTQTAVPIACCLYLLACLRCTACLRGMCLLLVCSVLRVGDPPFRRRARTFCTCPKPSQFCLWPPKLLAALLPALS